MQTSKSKIQTECSSDQRQQEALRHELPEEAASPRAERASHGHLAFAASHARKRKVGHVGAGNQEDEAGGGQEKKQGRAGALCQFALQAVRDCGKACSLRIVLW